MKNFSQINNCSELESESSCLVKIPTAAADQTSLNTGLSIVFGVIAAVAIILIIIQGIRFVLSSGDPQKANDARKGIIYALVGLGVCVSAEIIINFVIGRI